MTHKFLVSPIGQHSAILGIKWLEHEQPEIDWSLRQLSFPIPHSEFAHIAQEEEADDNPLEGIPTQYHTFAKVFGEEELKFTWINQLQISGPRFSNSTKSTQSHLKYKPGAIDPLSR